MSTPADQGSRALPPLLIDELVRELRAGGYSRAAWRRFFSRGWARSREAVREEPARLRSFLIWASVAAVLGAAALVVAGAADPRTGWLRSSLLWGGWYVVTSTFVLLHLGMVETDDRRPRKGLLLPNGLSYLRLAHAPLVCIVLGAAGTRSTEGTILCVYLALIVGTDLLDGFLARTLKQTSRLGGMLDALADMAALVSLAVGLHRHGMISSLLLALFLVRYPGALLGGIVLGFLRGPLPLEHTLIGRITSFSSSFLLVAAAVVLLAAPRWLPPTWVATGLSALTGLVIVNIGYLVYRAVRA